MAVDVQTSGDATDGGSGGSPAGTVPVTPGGRWLAGAGLVAGLVAVLAALVLPFAPVSVDRPEVAWPADPAAAQPTMLNLTAYRPLALDATIGCGFAQRAAASPDPVVLSTVRPTPDALTAGLVVSAAAGELTVLSRGDVVAREPIGLVPCLFLLTGSGDELTVSRDGREVGRGPMPDVDVLRSGVTAAPGATVADLDVRVTVDDGFSTSPAPAKIALLGLLAIAVPLSIAFLVVDDRRRRPWRRRRRDRPRVGVIGPACDAVVVAALVLWLFLAPLTNDDGYYSAMAANSPFAGYVGNYYQLFNQGFTPFTWIYVALAGWQHVAGVAPVALRVPALVCGLLIWLCVRRLAAGTRAGRWTVPVLAVTFLAWWMPFDMGLRPETVVALAAALSLLCLVRAGRTGSLLLVATAVGVSSVGLMAAPSGLVALAPLVAGAPSVWRLFAGPGRLAVVARVVCVLAAGALGAVAACGDGSWRDFVRAQQLLADADVGETFYTEYSRYVSLFASGSSTYAHRAVVLLTVIALAGFLVLWVASRVAGRRLPPVLTLAAASTAAAFVLLSPTPSKPWMHFGAIAGIGALFLGLLLVHGPETVRELTGARRLPVPAVVAAVGVVALTLALAGAGENTWWLASWSPRLPHAGTPPQVWIFRFDQPVWWLLAVLAVAGLLVLRRRPRPVVPAALATVVVLFLAANVAYMTGSFGLEAVRTAGSWSVAADNVRDPAARDCGAGSQVEAAAPGGTPLPVASGPAPGPLVRDPSGGPEPGDAVWTNVAPGTTVPVTGTGATPWSVLPPPGPDVVVSAFVSGRADEGNEVAVEYGRRTPGGVTPVDRRRVDPATRRPPDAWYGVDLASRDTPPPAGADAVRLVAVSARADASGRVAVTEPRASRFVAVRDLVPAGAPTALSWDSALLFPCLRQPRLAGGIAEPPGWAVGFTSAPLGILDQVGWQTDRGDAFARTARQARITQLVTRFGDLPEVRRVQVYRFEQPYPADDLRVTPARETVSGLRP